MLQSICTLATHDCYQELELMLYSLHLLKFELPIYILCDSRVFKKLQLCKKLFTTLKIFEFNKLDKYTNENRDTMTQKGIWTEFMLKKCDIIDIALEKHENTMMCDSDFIFLNKFNINTDKDILLSNHEVNNNISTKYGVYNGGCLYVKHKGFTKWWREETLKDTRYFEQKVLETSVKHFNHGVLGNEHNFGWWRLYMHKNNNTDQLEKRFSIKNKKVYFDNTPLVSFHTHILGKLGMMVKFRKFILDLLKDSEHGQLRRYLVHYAVKNKTLA